MPIYPLRCTGPDAHRFEDFHKMSEAHPPCPHCKAPTEIDAGALHIKTDRRFGTSDGRSLRFGFHPDEVAEARRELPNANITDDGDVYFNTAGDIRAFERDVERMRDRTRAQEERQREAESKIPQSARESVSVVDADGADQ